MYALVGRVYDSCAVPAIVYGSRNCVSGKYERGATLKSELSTHLLVTNTNAFPNVNVFLSANTKAKATHALLCTATSLTRRKR